MLSENIAKLGSIIVNKFFFLFLLNLINGLIIPKGFTFESFLSFHPYVKYKLEIFLSWSSSP